MLQKNSENSYKLRRAGEGVPRLDHTGAFWLIPPLHTSAKRTNIICLSMSVTNHFEVQCITRLSDKR